MQAQTNFNLDRSFFIVISELENGETVQHEMDLAWDRKTVLEMCKEGQFDNVLHIIESNPVEGFTRFVPAELIDDEIEVEQRVECFSASRFPSYVQPKNEHRISNFEAGTGRFGQHRR